MDTLGVLLIKSARPFKKTSTKIKVLNITLILQNNTLKKCTLIFPNAGPKGNSIIKTMNNRLKHILHDNVKTRVTYTGQNLVQSCRLKTKQKINTTMILFTTVNVQNQLLMKIT